MGVVSKSWEKKVILLKKETTEGVDATPVVGTNALQVLNYVPQFMDADNKVRNIEKAFFGADPAALANFKRGASFDMEMHGGGTANGTTIPQWMLFAAIAGMGDPVVGASSVVQSPTSTVPSATHYGFLDDLLLKTLGARGDFGFTLEDDSYPIFNCSLLGVPDQGLGSEVVPGNVTIAGFTTPVIASSENSTFTLDGFALPLRRWTMAQNAERELRSLIGPVDRIVFRDRAWSGTIVGELPTLTAKNYFPAIRSGAFLAAVATHGTVAGNIVNISAPRLQVTGNVELSEEQGKVMVTIPVTAVPVTGNDELVFTTS